MSCAMCCPAAVAAATPVPSSPVAAVLLLCLAARAGPACLLLWLSRCATLQTAAIGQDEPVNGPTALHVLPYQAFVVRGSSALV